MGNLEYRWYQNLQKEIPAMFQKFLQILRFLYLLLGWYLRIIIQYLAAN